MTQFELYGKNSYGTWLIATFYRKDSLDMFIAKVPPREKSGYYYIEITESREKHSINGW